MPDDENKEISDGADLSGMFKGGNINPPQEFHIEQPSYAETPKVIGWTMKISGGLIKNKNQAQYAILGFVALAIIVSLFLFFGRNNQTTPSPEKYINQPQFLP